VSWILTWVGRLFIGAIQQLPIEWVARIGRAGGNVAWFVDRRHRTVALQNLELALGSERSPQQLEAIARENFRRLGENYLCAIKTLGMSKEDLAPRFEVLNYQETLPKDGSNLIIAAGHFGNFELYASVREHAPTWPVITTYRALRQPSLNALFLQLRERSGVRYFERRTEARQLRKVLSAGHVVLGILSDQHAGDKGLWLPFFGKECSCSAAPALFALRFNAPIRGSAVYRVGLARWRIEFGEPIPLKDLDGSPRSPEAITRDINTFYENAIRRDPANWFWVHRRWKAPSPYQLRRLQSVSGTANTEESSAVDE